MTKATQLSGHESDRLDSGSLSGELATVSDGLASRIGSVETLAEGGAGSTPACSIDGIDSSIPLVIFDLKS